MFRIPQPGDHVEVYIKLPSGNWQWNATIVKRRYKNIVTGQDGFLAEWDLVCSHTIETIIQAWVADISYEQSWRWAPSEGREGA